MIPTTVVGYLRTMVAGLASALWRTITGQPCPCDMCCAHRQHIRDSARAYREQVHAHHNTRGRSW
jgi:hypothetical protein